MNFATKHRFTVKINRSILALVAACLAFLVLPIALPPSAVSAHPLGNFTVNRYSRIEPSLDVVRVYYILDMAEIPAFAERSLIDTDGDGSISALESNRYGHDKSRQLGRSVYLRVNGLPVALAVDSYELEFPIGQGGLNTLRLAVDYSAALPIDSNYRYSLEYRDENFPNKLGWKELLIRPASGITLNGSTFAEVDVSNGLTEYPKDFMVNPPNMLEARATIQIGPEIQPSDLRSSVNPSGLSPDSSDPLSSLISAEKLSLPVIVLSLMIAAGLGAFHAISPGHGKTIMAAYLVGTRGTSLHAIFLGFTVTTTHTIGVVALGVITLYASHLIAPEALYSWLGLASGMLILGIGGWLFISHIRRRDHSSHDHGHSHGHSHANGHLHDPPNTQAGLKVTWTTLTTLGITGGLVPSASALVILLAAVSMHRVGFGLILILAFGAGMAGALIGIGLALVYVRNAVERFQARHTLIRATARFIPLTSALVVLGSGLFMSARSALQFVSL
jgi:ABC-type nickel/cobalt efflux system permease component RcnA